MIAVIFVTGGIAAHWTVTRAARGTSEEYTNKYT